MIEYDDGRNKHRHPLEGPRPHDPDDPDSFPEPEDERPRGMRVVFPQVWSPTLTYILAGLNVLIFLAGFVNESWAQALFVWGANWAPGVLEQGEWYRLLAAMFLHAGIAHIFFNAYALYVIGSGIEPLIGPVRFALIYFLGGLGGSVLSVTLGTYDVPSVGASGAVFAIFAAYAVYLYLHRDVFAGTRARLQNVAFLIAINVFIGLLPGSNIDNWGHLGGFLGGALLAWLLLPRHRAQGMRADGTVQLVDTHPITRERLIPVGLYGLGLIALVVLGTFLT